ncbi:hypothetical protein QYE76_001452 [Lolium multiflorum]|uniref:CCHC-type domain-containing protein n=1 Tax=Lolium multiflorum TaxID=4521 RepID=A0AAD8VXD2_LOLMU|nr:hypothetical protein QYE76_001452 [Lolium multiflorum]
MQYVLEAPLGPPPPPAVSEDIKNVYETRVTRYSEVQCAILCSLEAELQKRFEHHDPCDMMRELKLIFETHAAVESYEASKQFFNCMMEEGSSVSEHMFAMSGHAKKLSDLGIVIPNQLGIHRVLQSLPPSYKNFVMNYNMQNMNKELPELFSMLKSAEVEIKKENQVLMVNKTTSFKKQGKPNKGNFKKGGKKVAAPPEKPKAGPKPETVCYYCQGKGHWKRNCSKYLADLKSGHVKKKETAAFTLNRAPSKSVETTPYELWFGKKPKLSFLKVWGCDAYVKKLQPDKLEPKAEKCVFIGYPKETIGYTFYHRSEGKIFVAKNGSFLEKEFLTKEVTGRKVELDEVDEPSLIDQSSAVPEEVPVQPAPIGEEANDDDHETSNEEATEPRRSTRERTTPDWYDPCLNVMIVDDNDEDPATYEEAMMSPDSNKWQEAMKSEMGSMYDNKVWTLVDLPDSRKAVENKWIFKRKTDADGNITVYKARLVAKGFRQIQGVDYDETFSPVAKLKSMDVKTAFLNGDIEEELYMVQPKGFVDPENANKVCKLQRSIYGLKQASRSWNLRFDRVIKDFGFIRTHGEACIYKKVSGSSVAFLILYVDDILLIGNDIELLSSIKGYLNKSFSMKDLGEAAYILGIKIYRDRSRRLIGLSQSTYLDKILKKFRMDESKKGFLPMLPGKVLSKTQGPATADERERMSKIPYASAVGSIMYAMLCTRPDIAHAVSLTSRYQSDPGMEHWTAVKNILKYLKRTKDMFLCYGGDQELVVTSYTDASWNTDPDDSKSQSGYVFILNGAAVSWSSSKQCTVAKSSTESEYIAASEASSEAVWMKRFIVELGVVPSALDPLVIYCDNTGAIANAKEPRSHKKLKHIKLRFHSIREYIEDGEVEICKVHTDLNVADPLTKALPRAKHDQHQNAMGVSQSLSSPPCSTSVPVSDTRYEDDTHRDEPRRDDRHRDDMRRDDWRRDDDRRCDDRCRDDRRCDEPRRDDRRRDEPRCGDPRRDTRIHDGGGKGRPDHAPTPFVDVRCHICMIYGHPASDCWWRYVNDDSDDDGDRDNKADHAAAYGIDTNCYSGTSATGHITGALNKLTTHDKYQGRDRVHTADGNEHTAEDAQDDTAENTVEIGAENTEKGEENGVPTDKSSTEIVADSIRHLRSKSRGRSYRPRCHIGRGAPEADPPASPTTGRGDPQMEEPASCARAVSPAHHIYVRMERPRSVTPARSPTHAGSCSASPVHYPDISHSTSPASTATADEDDSGVHSGDSGADTEADVTPPPAEPRTRLQEVIR